MKYAVGIDIGGTNTRVALIDSDMQVLDRVQFPTDTQDPEKTMEEIAKVIKGFGKPIEGIGISCPGPLDLIEGYVISTPNLGEKWYGFKSAKYLSDLLGVPAYLENDANLAALAEAVVGDGKDKRFVNFLTISTGVGSGQIVDKKIYNGAHGFAHEAANVIVWENGPVQGQLKPGAIEAISSGTAITKRAKERGLDVKHAGEVNDLANEGNEIAKEIMEEAKDYLANFIAALYAINDPEIVILGGSVATKIDGFTDDIQERVKEKVWEPLKPFVDIRKSTLNEDSGLIGAGYLALSNAEN